MVAVYTCGALPVYVCITVTHWNIHMVGICTSDVGSLTILGVHQVATSLF